MIKSSSTETQVSKLTVGILGCLAFCVTFMVLSSLPTGRVFQTALTSFMDFNNSRQGFLGRFRPKQAAKNHTTISDLIYNRFTAKVRKKNHLALLYAEEQKHLYIMDLNQTRCPNYFVAVHQTPGRLGNLLFQTASLLGIAMSVKKLPIFISTKRRHGIFSGFWIPYHYRTAFDGCVSCDCNRAFSTGNTVLLTELGAGKYSPDLLSQTVAARKAGFILEGWLQSWRYFDLQQAAVKLLFTFHEHIYNKALQILQNTLIKYHRENPAIFLQNLTLVGVHVRRGDFAENTDAHAAGLLPAPDAYLLAKLIELRQLYSDTIFIVASDDREYCQKLFRNHSDVLILDAYTAPVHMTVLTLMEHLVITTGSFGWWAAYLSDAKSVRYYADYPAPGSRFKEQFPKDDYFLPDWIGWTSNQTAT